jgi:hypothetical protein
VRVMFKPYKRKDGVLMLYINGSNGCSVALAPGVGFQSTKATKGEQKLVDAAFRVFNKEAELFSGDIEKHNELKAKCGNYLLAITDVATIGGMSVGSDGARSLESWRPLNQWC